MLDPRKLLIEDEDADADADEMRDSFRRSGCHLYRRIKWCVHEKKPWSASLKSLAASTMRAQRQRQHTQNSCESFLNSQDSSKSLKVAWHLGTGIPFNCAKKYKSSLSYPFREEGKSDSKNKLLQTFENTNDKLWIDFGSALDLSQQSSTSKRR